MHTRSSEKQSIRHDEPSLKDSGVRRARPWVLVCQQDPAVRARLAELLDGVGFAVWECADAGQAMAAARHVPRLAGLIVDLTEGLEVAEAVRRVQPGARVLCLPARKPERDTRTPDLEFLALLLAGATEPATVPGHATRRRRSA
jgi:CheY-like chemotaxis protein